ncbi:MAG TPA: hypothetical protein VN132_13180, partial [Bdellovibrio sp.]|nr:hypothetical protein [Bdellovibrio sp.]
NAGRALQEQGRAVEFARRNVDQVNSNINAAANVLGAQGNDQGINDGSREGIELGNQRGGNDGRDAGIREGTAAGTDAGQKRDYNTGYEAGKAKAISDATADSEAKAQKDGNENGRNDGIADGKNEAYRVGKNEGLDHGAKTGDDTVAYQAGRKQGEADGLAKAVSDAQAQVAVGYQEKENEFLNATLAPVTVGDSSLADKFKGLQGRYSNEGDDRYYNPQPGMLPHPRLQRFYMDAYDSAYRSTLSQSYASAYSASRNAQYTAYYNSTYNDNLNKSYPDWQQSGNGQGRADFYQRTFDANYATRYRQIHDDVHDKYFDQYKTDKGEHDRGFKDGNQIASRDKGYSEGKSAAYAANIEIEKKKAHDVGVKKANDLYTNNAVIKISSIEMKDVDGDGVLRPGENVVMMIKLKNYGLQAKTDLQSELSGVDGALSVASAKITTGTIPAKSDATVIVPVQAAISPTAVDGDTLSLTVSAKSGDKTYFTQKMAATAQYPVGAQIVGFDGILIPGVETPVTLKVTNRSKSIQNLNVTATVDTSKVGIDQNVLSAQGLNPGQSMDL